MSLNRDKKPFKMNVDVSNEEREEHNELLRMSGYKSVTISPSTPPDNTLCGKLVLGQCQRVVLVTLPI
jgi:hypothetical protein